MPNCHSFDLHFSLLISNFPFFFLMILATDFFLKNFSLQLCISCQASNNHIMNVNKAKERKLQVSKANFPFFSSCQFSRQPNRVLKQIKKDLPLLWLSPSWTPQQTLSLLLVKNAEFRIRFLESNSEKRQVDFLEILDWEIGRGGKVEDLRIWREAIDDGNQVERDFMEQGRCDEKAERILA